jgi:hypothetical protein
VTLFEANAEHWKTLTEKRPSDAFLRGDLARSLANLAQARLQDTSAQGHGFVTRDQLGRAHELHAQALALREQLEADHPQILSYSIDTAYSYLWLGRLAHLQGDGAATRQWCSRAIEKLQSVKQRSPKEPKLRHALYDAHFYRFASAEKSAAYEEGLGDIEALIALDQESRLGPPQQLERLQAARILYLARLGRHQQAFTAYQATPVSWREAWDSDAFYGLACAWSRCGSAIEADTSLTEAERNQLTAHYAELSVEMLKHTTQEGRVIADDQTQKLENDPELSWLRSRAEFQAFLDTLTD